MDEFSQQEYLYYLWIRMKLFQLNGPIINKSDNNNTENIGTVVISRELGVYDKRN